VSDGEEVRPSVDEALRRAINKHGHAFQHAVIRHGHELSSLSRARWQFNYAELPVEVRGHSTRVDFVLHQRSWDGTRISCYLVAECKRANPALAAWCFAKAPYVSREYDKCVRVDVVHRYPDRVSASGSELAYNQTVYGLAYEVRTDAKGDGAPGRGAIEEACTQVMRGVNGLIELMARQPSLLTYEQPTPVIPVVFTTADLWVTDVDVAVAERSTGELPVGSVQTRKVPWLWFRYQPSPGITHTLPRDAEARDLSHLADQWYTRCVAVVSPQGIAEFLGREYPG
jgi:hypothetical protein